MSTDSVIEAAPDRVRRFIFENQPVRGHWVRVGQGWRTMREFRDYSPPVRELLGQAVGASVLLAATLKFKGTLTLQIQGNGACGLLVAQCTDNFRFRALARAEGEGGTATELTPELFRWLVGDEGRLTVTIESEDSDMRYQGVVPLAGHSLAACLETYFASSEQLPTRLRLAANADFVAGLLVQQLPGAREEQEAAAAAAEVTGLTAWEQAQQGLDAVSRSELLECNAEELLLWNFKAGDVRLFEGSDTDFGCRCSTERVSGMLKSLGEAEVRDVLQEQGAVTVTCDFCNRPYTFDQPAVEALFGHVH